MYSFIKYFNFIFIILKMTLKLDKLNVSINGKKILENISFSLKRGEVVVFMGPNGAGKSSITKTIMSHPKYEIKSGKIFLDKEDITKLSADEKAKKGIFLSFQSPIEIPGVTLSNFLRTSYNSVTNKNMKTVDFFKLLTQKMDELKMEKKFRSRFLNVGFSGGEKKRVETLQMLLLEPNYIMLDELDSGLDVDALKMISESINKLREKKKVGVLIITHYNKILDYIKPDRVLVLKSGKIVDEGDAKLARDIEKKGFN